MFENETRMLIVLPGALLDRARGLAGRATTSMKLPVSLQIVVRALIEEGLKRPGDHAILANVERQAQTVRRIRSEARRRPSPPNRAAGPRPAAVARGHREGG
jgi:hypothetical protein